MKPLKEKKCKIGGEKFVPVRPFQPTCFKHAPEWLKQQQAKKWRKEGKVMKDKIKTHSQWIQELQVIFNRYIRLRDRGQLCICCDKTLKDSGVWKFQYDAGHFLSTGSYPNLRFNEDNCHGQTVHCNRDKHGNQLEYAIRLPKRIGEQRYQDLLKHRSEPLKLSIPEIKDLKTHYRKLITNLK